MSKKISIQRPKPIPLAQPRQATRAEAQQIRSITEQWRYVPRPRLFIYKRHVRDLSVFFYIQTIEGITIKAENLQDFIDFALYKISTL